MGIETVKEFSWLNTIWRTSRKNLLAEHEKPVIGILSIEVSRLMSKIANLWICLSDRQMSQLREELTNSIGLHKLVSDDCDYLMDLALIEIFENIRCVASSVARLGEKCADPVYHNLDRVFDNPFEINLNWYGWEYRLKKMERRVKKMERFAAVTTQLYEELEVLSELENSLRRMQANNVNQMKLHEFHQKVMWQREEVSGLREMSPWVRTYDYIVRLLLRSLLTIVQRVKIVFGMTHQMGSPVSNFTDSGCFVRSNSVSALTQASVYPSESSFGRSVSNLGQTQNRKSQTCYQPPVFCGKYPPIKPRRLAHVRSFTGCMTRRMDSPVCESTGSFTVDDSLQYDVMDPITTAYVFQPKPAASCNLLYSNQRMANTKGLTLGDAALALHYAKIIICIEKLAISPHFISLDARDDLYNMLTTSIKNSLRRKLSLFSKGEASSVYDRGLASDLTSSMGTVLDWLAPLAHDMIKWHSERNFEKQRMGYGGNVLLVQTLYYADQAKSEDAITELLMGLQYISRFGTEISDKAFVGSACGRACDDYSLHKDEVCSITLYD